MKLKGKVAIVTGGSRGIGASIVKRFSKEGAKVVVNYNSNKPKADALVKSIKDQGGVAIAIQANIADMVAIDKVVEQTCEAFGKIDILVNNAGSAALKVLNEITVEQVKQQFELNVYAPLFLTQKVAAKMSSGGRIINISSIAAKGGPGGSVYCATKAALNTLTKSYAAELGPQQITVNAIAPGAVETDLYVEAGLAERKDDIVKDTPLGRVGQPNDVSNLALFLASEESSWITGEIIQISGGRAM